MPHTESHPLAGQTVTLNDQAKDSTGEIVPGTVYHIEDWWDLLTGGSWMDAAGNPAALKYAMRSGMDAHLPLDNEVVYGKDQHGLGHLVHVSELGDVVVESAN